jgi:hypothetical protein
MLEKYHLEDGLAQTRLERVTAVGVEVIHLATGEPQIVKPGR